MKLQGYRNANISCQSVKSFEVPLLMVS